MHDAVVDLVVPALNIREVRPIGAVMTLVCILGDAVSLRHQLTLTPEGPLQDVSRLALLFEDPSECTLQCEFGFMLKVGLLDVQNVFDDEPVDGYHRDLLPCASVDLLALEAIVEP